MRPESGKFLFDIKNATDLIARFIENKTFKDYSSDPLLRSAVERQLMIIGEALTRLEKTDPEAISSIENYRKIIGFRHIIVHGYDIIEDATVWGILQSGFRELQVKISGLLKEFP